MTEDEDLPPRRALSMLVDSERSTRGVEFRIASGTYSLILLPDRRQSSAIYLRE